LVESALGYLETAAKTGFDQDCYLAEGLRRAHHHRGYRLIAGQVPHPLHLGVTAAGPLESGLIKGAIGVGTLLAEGLGDTVRISLTADPLAEVRVARHILEILHLRPRREPELISCPTCGRCEVNLIPLVNRVAKLLHDYPHPVKVP